MFTPWVLEQLDRPDDVGRFASIMWGDINNGCGSSSMRDPVSWKKHFELVHPKTSTALLILLSEAYAEYVHATSEVD
jgi:hypothetical protein